ncbi:MAG TPA: hypothetical protein VJR70_02895, partial [Stellaceae bacterium]|nr:hypothetical protein [Stellaceae bacterium]
MSDIPLTASDPDFGVPGATKFVPDVSETPIPQDTRDTFWNGESWQPRAPAADPQTEARAAGHSWRDIDDYVGARSQQAIDNGFSQRDIDREILDYRDPAGFIDRSKQGWAATLGADPDLLNGLAGPQPQLDLTQSPTLTSDYARAVMDREVKGPLDFADHYAAAALDAAHDVLGLDDSNLDDVRARQSAGAAAADMLAPSLPSTRDLTDAGLSLGGAFDQTRQNLLDHWQDTGQDPLDAAVKAQNDPALTDKLTAQPEFFDPAAAELQYTNDVAQDAANGLFQYFGWRYREIGNDLKAVFDEPLQHDAQGRPVLPPNISPQAFNIALAFATGPIHEVGPRIFGNLPEPKVSVVDPSKPPGEAVVEQPAAQALATPRPAERQPAPELFN